MAHTLPRPSHNHIKKYHCQHPVQNQQHQSTGNTEGLDSSAPKIPTTHNGEIKLGPNLILKTAHQHMEQILGKYFLSTGAITIEPGRLNSIYSEIKKGKEKIFMHNTMISISTNLCDLQAAMCTQDQYALVHYNDQ